MNRIRAAAVLAVLCGVSAAHAETTGLQVTLSPYAGGAFWDQLHKLDDSFMFGGRAGLAFSPWFGVEGTYGIGLTSLTAGGDMRVNHIGADAVFSLAPGRRLVPYVAGGWAQLEFDPDAGDTQTLNGWEAGLGVRWMLRDAIGLRLDARDVLVERDPDAKWLHDIFVTAGLHFALGGVVRDTDGDGVTDGKDRCEGTPVGVMVDATGCPTDSDRDGVWDGLDQCPGTPRGARVDAKGCPVDSDGDGVPDGPDNCGDTPRGATVDAAGCPSDADADGVWDGLDQCASTPRGAVVNELGCPIDSDRDGVYDGLDRCPATPEDVRVDAAGCPIEVNEKETQLLDTGMIRLSNINFETAKADLRPESFAALDEVGKILTQWPQLQIEIGGHTDSYGDEAYNRDLSRRRAQAVLDHLRGKFPDLGESQYTVKGYGEAQPVADNATRDGRTLNRRVEFKVLNTETLKKEVERRKLLRKP